ncbi:S1C family serine protease [Botrimarina sp.]|uniref:S1C family serine protease n=1 Tax=Botrimarina sp. TaxID=2795802 RepID=UPI0032EF6BF4
MRANHLLPLAALAVLGLSPPARATDAGGAPAASVVSNAQDAVVKLFGAGGVAGLEGYQTGVFIDDTGALLTIDSPVLDGGAVALVDALGDRYEGRVEGVDRLTGLALVRSESTEPPPAWIDLQPRDAPRRGERLWVLSNAFKIAAGAEPVTVQRARSAGVVAMPLAGGPLGGPNRPPIGAPAPGTPVLLLDAVTSNPGAGGGLVLDESGEAVGLVGAECRAESTGAWVNYALPTAAVAGALERLASGASAETGAEVANSSRRPFEEFGVFLIPEIMARTPAYVEGVAPGSAAETAGLRPDDLIVAVGGASTGALQAARRLAAESLRQTGAIELLVLREGEIVEIVLTQPR